MADQTQSLYVTQNIDFVKINNFYTKWF